MQTYQVWNQTPGYTAICKLLIHDNLLFIPCNYVYILEEPTVRKAQNAQLQFIWTETQLATYMQYFLNCINNQLALYTAVPSQLYIDPSYTATADCTAQLYAKL